VKYLALLVLAACGGTQVAPDATIGTDTTVTAFSGTWVHFGDPNTRQVDAPVAFPAPGQRWKKVTLHLSLSCPTGGCDWWDRLGHLSIMQGKLEVEVARFITPFRVGADLTLDVTDLQRLLEGDVTMRLFIDTWVGPGGANGAGWMVDASFDFVGGQPTPDPYAVIPLWPPQSIVYGDPSKPTAQYANVTIPDGANGGKVIALVTGHGQGNADNCGEFCEKEHTITVGTASAKTKIWRDDCATTAAPGQSGSYQYPRAGWCPGAIVEPWETDLGLVPGPLTIGYDVEPYTNTCRPDSPTCTGCTLGTGCAYDGGNHTEPNWQQSAVLVLTR
jgi:hypothetical protein